MAAAIDGAVRALAAAPGTSDTAAVPDASLQALLAAAVCAYAARVEQGGALPAFPPGIVTATDVAVTATAMLDAVGVGVFELGMWQTIKTPAPR